MSSKKILRQDFDKFICQSFDFWFKVFYRMMAARCADAQASTSAGRRRTSRTGKGLSVQADPSARAKRRTCAPRRSRGAHKASRRPRVGRAEGGGWLCALNRVRM